MNIKHFEGSPTIGEQAGTYTNDVAWVAKTHKAIAEGRTILVFSIENKYLEDMRGNVTTNAFVLGSEIDKIIQQHIQNPPK